MNGGEEFVTSLNGGVGHLSRDTVADFTEHANVGVHAQEGHHGGGERIVGG